MKVTVGYNPPNPYHGLEHFESGDIVLSELGSVPYVVYEVLQKQLLAIPLDPERGHMVTTATTQSNLYPSPQARFRALRAGERVVIEGE
jgi:hypothetical protein